MTKMEKKKRNTIKIITFKSTTAHDSIRIENGMQKLIIKLATFVFSVDIFQLKKGNKSI